MEVSHAYLVLLFRKPTGTYQALSVFRVDGRRVVNGIIYVIKHGLQWQDAPDEYGPHKTRTIALSGGAGSVFSIKFSLS